MNVKAQKPRTLYEACELARVYEERYEGHRTHARGAASNRTPATTSVVSPLKSGALPLNSRPLISNQGGAKPHTSATATGDLHKQNIRREGQEINVSFVKKLSSRDIIVGEDK